MHHETPTTKDVRRYGIEGVDQLLDLPEEVLEVEIVDNGKLVSTTGRGIRWVVRGGGRRGRVWSVVTNIAQDEDSFHRKVPEGPVLTVVNE